MHSVIATQIVHTPESSSPSDERTRSFARFISAMVLPLALAISSMAAAVPKGNGNRRPSSSPFRAVPLASASSVTMKPPPME